MRGPQAGEKQVTVHRWPIPMALGALLGLHTAGALGQPPEAPVPPRDADTDAPARSARSARIILLVRAPDDDEAITHLHAELRATAWEIVELRLEDRAGQRSLEELAARQSAHAALRVDTARREIALWIAASQVPNASHAISETLSVDVAEPDGRVMALRATEALRAYGLDLAPGLAPTQDEALVPLSGKAAASLEPITATDISGEPLLAPTPGDGDESTRGEPDASRRWWLEAGPSAVMAPGGLAPVIGAALGTRIDLTRDWAAGALAFIPVGSAEVTAGEGSASVTAFLLGLGADVRLLATERWHIDAGPAVSWAWSSMEGRPRAGYAGATETVHALTPLARGSAHFRLGARLYLVTRLTVGATFPRISVQFARREVAAFGQPLVLTTLGVEIPVALGSTSTR